MNTWHVLLGCALALMLAQCMHDAHADWTVHTVSLHAQHGMNNLNPGLGFDLRPDWRVGAYYNSYKDVSAYSLYIHPLTDRLRIGVGLVTGYRWEGGVEKGEGRHVIPMLGLEYDINHRLSLGFFGTAVNLEVKFR